SRPKHNEMANHQATQVVKQEPEWESQFVVTETSASRPINTSSQTFGQFESNDNAVVIKEDPDALLNMKQSIGVNVNHSSSISTTPSGDKVRRNLSSKGSFNCELCGKVFTIRGSMRTHVKSCQTTFSCEHCGKVFKYASRMRYHASSCRH